MAFHLELGADRCLGGVLALGLACAAVSLDVARLSGRWKRDDSAGACV